jgi:iron complex outermembrane receptor protein
MSSSSQVFRFDKSGSVDSYELGLKSDLAGGSLRLNIAAFYLEWKDQHASIQTTSAATVEFYNVPKLKVSGVELDSTWVPVDPLTLNLAVSYLHDDKKDGGIPPDFIDPSGGGTQTSDNIVSLPELTASLAMNWDVADLGWSKMRLAADVNYSDQYWSVPKVGVPADSFTLVNARLSLAEIHALGGRLDVSLWGRNLTDDKYRTWVYAAPGITAANTFGNYGDPRTYGIAATRKYCWTRDARGECISIPQQMPRHVGVAVAPSWLCPVLLGCRGAGADTGAPNMMCLRNRVGGNTQ